MKISKSFTIKNDLGLHARVAALIVKVTEKYQSTVALEKNGEKADGKSILDILTLACPKGSVITVTADGDDAGSVLEELGALIESKFGEN